MRSPRLRLNPPPATAARRRLPRISSAPETWWKCSPTSPDTAGPTSPPPSGPSHANPRLHRRLRRLRLPARGGRRGVPATPAPPDAPRGVPPAEHAVVDAFKGGAWWVGVALGGGRAAAGGRVAVCFPETREVVEFDAADVRPHLEWVAGEWLSPENMVQSPASNFQTDKMYAIL